MAITHFTPHFAKAKKGNFHKWPSNKTYPVIAIDIENFTSHTEKQKKIHPPAQTSGIAIADYDEDEEDEAVNGIVTESNVEQISQIMFLLANPKTGKYAWFNAGEVRYANLLNERPNK